MSMLKFAGMFGTLNRLDVDVTRLKNAPNSRARKKAEGVLNRRIVSEAGPLKREISIAGGLAGLGLGLGGTAVAGIMKHYGNLSGKKALLLGLGAPIALGGLTALEGRMMGKALVDQAKKGKSKNAQDFLS